MSHDVGRVRVLDDEDEGVDNEEIHGRTISQWIDGYSLIKPLISCEETHWFNPGVLPAHMGLTRVGLARADIDDAAARLKRWAPYIRHVFPTTLTTMGIFESPFQAIPHVKAVLEHEVGHRLPGAWWIKLDSELPVAGSVKARGGIYEVLKHAETLAVDAGILTTCDDYRKINSDKFRNFYGQYSVAVGSTGNLGLAIGIMSAKLGFHATVHMSHDARQWKKDKLRENGVTVIEYDSDFSVAVTEGRKAAENDPMCYFVDDENSTDLFLGYSVAARRLRGQLTAMDITVDEDHPLFIYSPCGVGGGPGGVGFGMKTEFGNNVHLVFCEPTHCPSVFMGVYTGLHSGMSVHDFGIDNLTAADGLAVGRPSGFVGPHMQALVDGYVTVADNHLYRMLAQLHASEGLDIEPSSTAGLAGIAAVIDDSAYRKRLGLTDAKMANATHIAWATGGSMVPRDEMDEYIHKGVELMN